jgi:hypothetical protein
MIPVIDVFTSGRQRFMTVGGEHVTALPISFDKSQLLIKKYLGILVLNKHAHKLRRDFIF